MGEAGYIKEKSISHELGYNSLNRLARVGKLEAGRYDWTLPNIGEEYEDECADSCGYVE
jgi:hypothetical protein